MKFFSLKNKYCLTILFTFAILFVISCGKIENQQELTTQSADTLSLKIDTNYFLIAGKIDTFFRNRYKIGVFNGAVLFADSGKIVFKGTYGYSNFRTRDTLKTTSAFQLASVTKPFTAYAIMLLKEREQIKYTDSLRKFFPEFPYDNISIRQLLTHRSGLPNYMYFADKYWPDRKSAISNEDVIKLMINYEPMKYYKPDFRYNYSNTGYSLLASIIEKVSGISYEDFMKKEIFEPLGMNNTSVYNKTKQPQNSNTIIGYLSRRRKADNTYLNGVIGDKGIYSTVEDLFIFDRAMYSGKLVSKEALEEAYLPAHKDLYDNDNYGLGWRINKRKDGSKIVHHEGWWKGFRAYLIRSLKEDKTIIVLSNVSRNGLLSVRELLELFEINPD